MMQKEIECEDTLTAHIASALEDMPIISTHEHHMSTGGASSSEPMGLDWVLAHSYCGWTDAAFPMDHSAEKRDEFLDSIRFRSYFRWMTKSLRRLYRFEGELTSHNWDEISFAIGNAHTDPDWRFHILRDYCHIERAIIDTYWDPGSDGGHPSVYSPTFRVDPFIVGHHPTANDHNGNNAHDILASMGLAPEAKNLKSYLSVLREAVVRKRNEGAVALKVAVAYERPLDFSDVSCEDAARIYSKCGVGVTPVEEKAFGDYIMSVLADIASSLDLPVQVHTGLGRLGGSDPMRLIPIIERTPMTRWVLFHGGYPWVHQIGGLIHNYSNVYADLVWLPMISPTAAISAILEWMEVAQNSSKLMWGGDSWTSEETYAAVLAIRHALKSALSHQVRVGYIDEAAAIAYAQHVLFHNAKSLYNL